MHGGIDLGDHTKAEIEDLTGCVPLLLTDVVRGGSIDLLAPTVLEVLDQVQEFCQEKWVELSGTTSEWDGDYYLPRHASCS
jgi:hypothetical protein